MTDYLYDGTFEGLLTCIYYHYYGERASGIFRREYYQSCMLGGYTDVETDEEKAIRVYDAIEKKISPYDLRRIYKVFLSDDEDKEIKILKYVVLGFKLGGKVSLLHGDPVVFDVQSIEKKINVEKERMLQFVRFRVMKDGIMYAVIEPDNDVIELIAEHFCNRFRNEPFIIHDKRRSKALIAFGKRWYISAFTEENVPDESADDRAYRKLWKEYFDNIAIKERRNPVCQRNNMPLRYRKHLTEMESL